MNPETHGFETLRKWELIALCDRLLAGDASAVKECVAFIEAETMGIWHGRARAQMSRRLKHCKLSDSQRARLVDAIMGRFTAGRFSEQFKDQLRLVLRLEPRKVFAIARKCRASSLAHVRRYAEWILVHDGRA